MTLEEVVIAIYRILGSLPVLRWAFAGAWIALVTDFFDLFLRQGIDLGGVRDYQTFDKVADLAYMLTFLIVALRWEAPVRNIAVGLFVFRMAGYAAFGISGGDREVLPFFPNIFDFWFVVVAGIKHYRPDHVFDRRTIVPVLAGCTVVKVGQEVFLHQIKWLDTFSAFEGAEAIWDFLRDLFTWGGPVVRSLSG